MNDKKTIQDYTEQEFLEFLQKFDEDGGREGDEYANYIHSLVEHFAQVVEHPAGTDIIFYPEPGTEESPEGWLAVIKAWMVENNKPGFKSA